MTVSFDAINTPDIPKEKERRPSARLSAAKATSAPQHHRKRPHSAGEWSMLTVGAISAVIAIGAAYVLISRPVHREAMAENNEKKQTVVANSSDSEIRSESKPPIVNIQTPTLRVNDTIKSSFEKIADTPDPRETRGQSMLDQAQKAFAASPRNLSGYRESLKAIQDGYGSTTAGREAANILKTMDAETQVAANTALTVTSPVTVTSPEVAQTASVLDEKVSKELIHKASPSAYAVWLKSFHAHFSKHDWMGARQSVAVAFKNPELESQSNVLKADQECVALAESAEQATAKGAAMLLDGRPFILESIKKKDKFELGRKAKVKNADANAITIEQDIDGGKIEFSLPLADLTRDSSLALAQIAVTDGGKGKLSLTLLRFADCMKDGSLDKSDAKLEELLAQTRKAQPPAELFSRLQSWLAQLDHEKQAAASLAAVDRVITGGKADESRDALKKFITEFSDTAFIVEHANAVHALETRLETLRLQPGLLAKYFSGDIDNHRKIYYCSRAMTSLEQDFGMRGPAPGVPNEKYDIEMTGKIRIKDAGEYTFNFIGDDFLEVWLDDKSIGRAQWDHQVSVKVDLPAGDHKIKVVHSNNVSNASFKIRWKRPGPQQEESIPLGVLFHVADEPHG